MRKKVYNVVFKNKLTGQLSPFNGIEGISRLREVIRLRKSKGWIVLSINKEIVEYLPLY